MWTGLSVVMVIFKLNTRNKINCFYYLCQNNTGFNKNQMEQNIWKHIKTIFKTTDKLYWYLTIHNYLLSPLKLKQSLTHLQQLRISFFIFVLSIADIHTLTQRGLAIIMEKYCKHAKMRYMLHRLHTGTRISQKNNNC